MSFHILLSDIEPPNQPGQMAVSVDNDNSQHRYVITTLDEGTMINDAGLIMVQG